MKVSMELRIGDVVVPQEHPGISDMDVFSLHGTLVGTLSLSAPGRAVGFISSPGGGRRKVVISLKNGRLGVAEEWSVKKLSPPGG